MIYNFENTNTIVLMIAFNKITDFCICNKILNKFVKQIDVQNFTQKYILDIGQIFVKIRIRRNLINKYYSINKCQFS